MSDTVAAPMSPEDHDHDAPHVRMKWLDTLFNPLGRSNKVEFTRAWTLLFFLQLFVVVIPFGLAIVAGLAGGDGGPIGKFGLYASPVVFVVTTLLSFIIHARRLQDAGKWVVLSGIVLVPLIIGMMQFTSGLQSKAAAYDALYEKRTDYLADPKAWNIAHQAEQKIQQAARSRVQANRKIANEIKSDAGDLIPTFFFGEYAKKARNPERWQAQKLERFESIKARIKAARSPGNVMQDMLKNMLSPGVETGDAATWQAENLATFAPLKAAVDTAYLTEAKAESFWLSLLYGVDQAKLAQDEPAQPEEGKDAAEPSARYKVMQRLAFEPTPYTEAGIADLQTQSEAALEGIGYYTTRKFVERALNQQSPQYRADAKLPSQRGFVLEPNLGTIQQVIIPMSFFIMFWSLLWVARKPTRDDDPLFS